MVPVMTMLLVPAIVVAAVPAMMPARAVAIEAVVPMSPVPAMRLRLRFGARSETGEG
jgi:hypothetical protein